MSRIKTRSFLQSFSWVGILLIALGALFFSVGAVMQFVPIDPNSITVRMNGVLQPPSEESARTFRLIFLLTFGLIGLITAMIGAVISGRAAAQRRKAERLRETGTRIIAEAVDLEGSSVSVNGRVLTRLQCAYEQGGITYVFKSGLLRANPYHYLQDGKVTVYCDPNDMRHYFVDVDESVGLGSRLVEL